MRDRRAANVYVQKSNLTSLRMKHTKRNCIPEDHKQPTTKLAGRTRCSFRLLPCPTAQGSGEDGYYRAPNHVGMTADAVTHRLRTFFFMVDMRLRTSSISGSGALEEVAHVCWFGQPSQALALPASAEAVPGQFSGASSGGLLMETTLK